MLDNIGPVCERTQGLKLSILHDVIIIGAGPAGLTAGLYAGRAKLHTLILEKESIGGELMNRDIIENYPSYPNGIVGPELGSKMMQQAMNYGAEIMPCEVERIEIQNGYNLLKTSGGDFKGKGLIIAGGAHPKKLMVPGEEEFFNRGVFYCAACDGPRYTDKTVVVVGGGDSGMTEALSLSRIASKVTLIEILPHLTGTKILQERVLSHPKIEVQCNVKVDTIRGSNQVEAIDLVDMKTNINFLPLHN